MRLEDLARLDKGPFIPVITIVISEDGTLKVFVNLARDGGSIDRDARSRRTAACGGRLRSKSCRFLAHYVQQFRSLGNKAADDLLQLPIREARQQGVQGCE